MSAEPGALARGLRSLDIQPRPFRAFLWALVTMDLRSFHYGQATGTGDEATISPLFWVVGQLLFASLLLSAFLLGRVDAYFFALAGLSTAALCLLSAIVVEFNEAALDARDRTVVGHRPLTPRTYAAARMGNLLFYVALLGLALTVFPATVGAFLRDAGPWYVPAYLWASLLACVATAALVILLLTTVGAETSLEGAQSVLAWTQIVLIVAVFYAAQLVIRRGSSDLALFAADPPEWIVWLPTHWLARGVARVALEGPTPELLGGAALATGLVAALLAAAVVQLSRAYARLQTSPGAWRRSALPRPARAGTVTGGLLARAFTRGRAQATGFWLTRVHLARDPELKMRSWPLFSMAAAGVLLGIATGNFGDPFRVQGATAVLPLAAVALLASALPPLVQNVSFSRDPEAAWLLAQAPLPDAAALVAGVRQALLVSFFYPLLLCFFVALTASWRDPLHALGHTLVAWLVVEGAARWSVGAVLRGYPFREAMARGATMGPVALASGVVVGASSLLLGGYLFAARSLPLFLGYCAGLVGLVLLADRWSGARVRAHLARVRDG
ncbi:MAG: hypothetical protein AB7N76_02570 [Planctomycetota bacterium]